MLRSASKKLFLGPDVSDNQTIYLKHGMGTRVGGNRKRVTIFFSCRMLKSSTHSPAKLLWRLGAQVARKALRCVSMRRRSSQKVSSASLARSRSLADAIDSQRAEAVEDCIEFINSSSSLRRSFSVSAYSN